MARKKAQAKTTGATPAAAAPSGYNVFLMWSGAMSKAVASILRVWLPKVLQFAKPWMSETDIDRGAVWEAELLGQLQTQRFGIACLTPEIPGGSSWMLFEGGALWRSEPGSSRICTYLLDIKPNDVHQPLQKFQSSVADKGNTFAMIRSLNKALGMPLDEPALLDSFEVRWLELEDALKKIPRGATSKPAARPAAEALDEILTATRSQDRALQALVSWAASAEKTLAEIKAAHPSSLQSLSGFGWIPTGVSANPSGTPMVSSNPVYMSSGPITRGGGGPYDHPESAKLRGMMGIANDLVTHAKAAEAMDNVMKGIRDAERKAKKEARRLAKKG